MVYKKITIGIYLKIYYWICIYFSKDQKKNYENHKYPNNYHPRIIIKIYKNGKEILKVMRILIRHLVYMFIKTQVYYYKGNN